MPEVNLSPPKRPAPFDSAAAQHQDLHIRITTGSSATSHGDASVFLETILRSVTDYAIITLDRNGVVTSWNEGACLILGWSKDEMLGKPASTFFTVQDNLDGILRDEMDDALTRGRGADERWHIRKDGSTFWASGEMMPLTGADGTVPGFVKILRDRTRERATSERQRLESEYLRGIRAASRDGISVLALDGSLTTEDEGWPARQGIALPSVREGKADVAAAFEAARSGGTGHFETTTSASGPDGTRYWDVSVTPILGANGRPERLLAVSREISDLRRAEQRQRLLMQELSHRVKNTLAMVQAIASQTLSGPTMPVGLREDFTARLLALSHAHDMLMHGDWSKADLRPIVEGIARLHGLRTSDRFRIAGPTVTLGPRSALSFALVLHELGTNAIKHGALSNGSGRVDVTWQVDEMPEGPLFRLQWKERGGPAVKPQSRRGFGTRLIAHSFPASGGVRAVMTYRPKGVNVTLEAALNIIQEP